MTKDSRDIQLTDKVRQLSSGLARLADRTWQQLSETPGVQAQLAKDPITREQKEHAATAELLILFLHACDRVASAAFLAAIARDRALALRQSFMSAVVGTTLPAFAATICRANDPESRQAMQADLLHLYNTRATQYGFFPLATDNSAESSQGPLLSLAGIRLTEGLDCPDDAALLSLAIESVAGGLTRMREELPLQDTIRHVMTRIQ